MKKQRKKIREKGKIKISRYFQKFEAGDKVAFDRELSIKANVHRRMQGKTGTIESKRGRAYVVKIKDHNKEKRFIIQPIHLRRIT